MTNTNAALAAATTATFDITLFSLTTSLAAALAAAFAAALAATARFSQATICISMTLSNPVQWQSCEPLTAM